MTRAIHRAMEGTLVRRGPALAAALLSALLLAGEARAFSVVLTGNTTECTGIPEEINRELFDWYFTRSYTPPYSIEGPPSVTVVAHGPGGRILGVQHEGGSTADLVTVRPGLPPQPLGNFPLSAIPTRAVADAAGNLFLLLHGQELLQLGPDGSIRARTVLATGHPLSHFISGMDLAADQCTLYLTRVRDGGSASWYDDQSSLQTFNVCTRALGPEIVGPETASFWDVKILPDGNLLVAADMDLRRYDPSGTLLQTLSTPGWRGERVDSIALTASGRAALLSYRCGAPLREWSLVTGELRRQEMFGIGRTRSMLVASGWTAALGHVSLNDVPTLSEVLLFALTGLLSLLGLRRLYS